MATQGDKRPIIIKKVKKVSGGHHGGAWKVAYADFVTAMMAFFLLLWLLSTSSKETLAGLAEFFTPTVGIKDSQGIGFQGGLAQSKEGVSKSDMATPSVVVGATPSGAVATNPDNPAIDQGDEDDNLFKEGAAALQQAFQRNKLLQQYQDNINIQQTPEGLKIDVMDSEKFPMFEVGNAQLTEHGKIVLAGIGNMLVRVPNGLAITGHTDASPLEAGRTDYSNWEISSDRAQAARRFLLKTGVDPELPKRVVGMADKELMVPDEPRSPRNRRISIVMLRGSHILIPDSAVPQTQDMLSAPKP